MKNLIIFSHPTKDSFNGAVLSTIVRELDNKGWEYRINDLYSDGFNPVLTLEEWENQSKNIYSEDVEKQQRDILWADNIFLIYPIWWMSMPAMLKGWIDKVITEGFARKKENGEIIKTLEEKSLYIFTTSGRTKEKLAKGYDEAMDKVLLDGTFKYCSFKNMNRKNSYGVTSATDEERKNMLKEIEELVRNL